MTYVSSDLAGLASFKSIAWSHFQNLCAVILSDNSVHFFDDAGNELYHNSFNRSARATALAFSPKMNMLAVGWSDGKVTTWSNGNVMESAAQLSAPVNLLAWHPTELLLMSTAENGAVCVWDCSTIILPLYQEKTEVQFDHGSFCPTELPYAFLTDTQGGLYGVDTTDKSIIKINDLQSPIHCFTTCAATRRLIVIHGENLLTQYTFPPALGKYSQVKLPAGNPPTLIKIRQDVYAYNISDTITVINMQNEENLNIRAPGGQTLTSIGFIPSKGVLFAATENGSLITWRATMKGIFHSTGWSEPNIIDSRCRIERFHSSPFTGSFLAECNSRRPLMFREINMRASVSHDIVVWMTAHDMLTVAGQDPTRVAYTIERLSISNSYVVATSAISTDIFTIRSGGLFPFSRMTPNTALVAISSENIYNCREGALEVRNLQGTVKQTMSLGTQAPPQFLTVNGHFVCVVCSDMSVFLFDISRRSPKLQYSTTFSAPFETYRIREVSSSCGGFCIAVSIDVYSDGQWTPSPQLFLHSPQFDKTVTAEFDGRVPLGHGWDAEDSRLLCVEAAPFNSSLESKLTGTVIVPLFVSDSLTVFRQSILSVPDNAHLCQVEIPRVYVQERGGESPVPMVLPQFEGLDAADEGSRKALMELNFHLAAGDIDSAFNAIRGIENQGIWRSLAQMCAQMRRIDLADLCFGRMEDAASAILLRKVRERGDDTAALVLVDSQLNLVNEAKKVAMDNRRFDELAKVHRSVSEWKEAIQTTTVNDRIHSRAAQYASGRSHEIRGEYKEAIECFERAGVIASELPRLALQANDLKLFFSYISERSVSEIPPKLLVWIGRFYEAHSQPEQAMEYFEYANAVEEIVRLLCCTDRWDEAAKRVQKCSQRSVIASFTRLLIKRIEHYSKPENSDPQVDVEKMKKQVIELFRRAHQFAQAMEFALANEMVDDILALSFSAPTPLICKAAQWFEGQKEAKNAILLYSRCGKMNRALALCFVSKQYDALDEISDTLTSKTDPQILLRCGAYFVESQRWSKAAQCFVLARQYDQVMQLCNEHNVKLPGAVLQELADDQSDPDLIRRFAALCEQQTAYQIAASLYVKLKDPVSAMKALIRAGNTEKVIKFAKLVRRRETFVLAANYIMTTNPRDGDSSFDTVVMFYNKANVPDKLARFYESAAQTEIDEYQEYEKGLELLQRAADVLQQSELAERDQLLQALQNKTRLIQLYIGASQVVKDDPSKALAVCVQLLKTKGIETCMRPDDIYILMVQCYVAQSNFQAAHKILEDLRNNGTDITWFMEVESIQKIYQAVGDTFEGGASDGDYDDIIEDISDIVED